MIHSQCYYTDSCTSTNDNIVLGSKCYMVEGRFEIFYSTIDNKQTINIDLVELVFNSFKNKLKDIPNEIDSIGRIIISPPLGNKNTNTTIDIDLSSPASNGALIGVAVVCSTLIIAAIAIMSRGRRKSSNRQKSNYSQSAEMTSIVPDRNIRSDDSVFNSSSMSSAARGWDDAGRSEDGSRSDVVSDTSSRPSFTVQLEEGSQGIEATRGSLYQSGYSTYLPSSVLKDLLDGSGQNKSFDMLDNVDV